MKRYLFWPILSACLTLALVLGFTTKVHAGTAAREAAAIRPVDDAWRAALPRDPGQATQAYLDRISPAARARSDAYFVGGYGFQLAGAAVTLAAFWLLLGTGMSARMRDRAERITRRKPLQTMLYTAMFMLAVTGLNLPMTVLVGFTREHGYGMANQTFGPWLGEQLIGMAVSIVLIALFLVPLYGVMRRSPRTWWIWGSLVGAALLVVVMVLSPVLIDPLFNSYKPLPEGPVREAVLSLARSEGVPAKDVYQFDASKQTSNISANVSGLFGSSAIRLNDNLLKRCTLPEIRGVVGHEIGHYVLNHVYKSLPELGLILVAGLAFVGWAFEAVRRGWGRNWGIRELGDPAGLPLFAGLFTLFMLAATPVTNTIVRVQEAEADLFGVNACQDPAGFAEGQLKLIEYRKADPGLAEEIFFYDHPSPRKRIYTAMRWKAEHGRMFHVERSTT